jgi:predicted nucleotidyltransferase
MIPLQPDFKEFLRLLNSQGVEYLLVGGYAVGHYGYPRATADMDIWVSRAGGNPIKVLAVLKQYGFMQDELTADLLSTPNQIIRMGKPPVRIEVLTSISGVEFDTCFGRRLMAEVDGIPVPLISLEDLKINKKAADRHKDRDDLEHLA